MEWKEFQSGPRKGQPRTGVDHIIRYVVKGLGYTEVPSPSRRYRKFIHEGDQPLWVGRKGAVRIGQTISRSRSATRLTLTCVQAWEYREGLA